MRLIDVDALLSGFDVRKVVEYDESGCGMDYKAVPVEAIVNAPTIDAEPVRHGRWVENIVVDTRACPPYSYKNGYACSLCDRITRTNNEPYCHCGAKMDLEVRL